MEITEEELAEIIRSVDESLKDIVQALFEIRFLTAMLERGLAWQIARALEDKP